MKRRFIIRLGLLVLGGAIVNVAVAWGTIYFRSNIVDDEQVRDLSKDEMNALFGLYAHGEWRGHENDDGIQICQWGELTSEATGILQHDSGARLSYYIVETRVGWPLHSLRCALRLQGDGIRIRDVPSALASGIRKQPTISDRLGSFRSGRHRLPRNPIFHGFAINTIFYAAILWLLFAAPFTLRRWRRIRRGLCAACGYPVGESEVCTECGTAVRPSGAQACSHG